MLQAAQIIPTPLTPPLKWAGGKRWLVPRLARLWLPYSANHRLVEPFVGGMSVALGLQPSQALLNDVNPHLINFYRWLQTGLVVELEFENDSNYYYQARDRFNELIFSGYHESKEAAELFYFLNRTGFNGLCRFNKSGGFNVPFGRYKTINYIYDFLDYSEQLADWEFSSGDFSDLHYETNDFVYADPPYDVDFTSYSAGGFTWEDQIRLAELLSSLTGPVVASNEATPRVLKLYKSLGFSIHTLEAPRRISSDGDRTPALEMIATLNLSSFI